METNRSSLNSKRERYNLASASNRIFARLIDFLIMTIFSISFACFIFLTDPGFSGNILSFSVTEPYRYFIFVITISIGFLSYFVILPYFWNGQTLGLKSFKLAIYNIVFSHFINNIWKRELLVWVINSFINLMFGTTLFIVGSIKGCEISNQIIKNMYQHDTSFHFFSISIIFTTLYMVSAMLLILVLFSIILNSKKQCLIDRISNTVTVKKIDVSGSDKQNDNLNKKRELPKRYFNLPGVILDNPHEEINGEKN